MDEDLPVMVRFKNMLHAWFLSEPKTFFAGGIIKFVNHYTVHTGRGMIVLRNDTLCICYRLLYMNQLIN
jgi:hypothetical protein